MRRFITPQEAASPSFEEVRELETLVERVNGTLQRHDFRSPATVAASLVPPRLKTLFVRELEQAGWLVVLEPDSREGPYYAISPRYGSEKDD